MANAKAESWKVKSEKGQKPKTKVTTKKNGKTDAEAEVFDIRKAN